MKNFLIFIAKICISIALLVFLFTRIDLHKTISYIRTVEPFYFICAALLFLLVMFLGILRWCVLLKTLKKDLSFWRIFASHCGGLFFNVFLPSTIGGDIAKTVDLSLHTKDSSSIFATVFLDRLCGFLALVLISISGFIYSYFFGLIRDLRLLGFILIFTAIVIGVFLLVFSKRTFNLVNKIIKWKVLKNYFSKFHNCCYPFRFQKKAIFKTIIVSLLIQGFFAVTVYFFGMSLGIRLSVVYYLILIPIVNTVSFLPISLGGLGLRDNVAVVLFSSLGVASDKVAAMTLLIFAFLFFFGIMGGIIYGTSLYCRRLQRH